MAVISCHHSRDTPPTARFDERNRGTYAVTFEVQCDTVMAPGAVANGALAASPTPLPALWASYSYLGQTDVTSYARTFDVRLKNPVVSHYVWLITVSYQPLQPGEQPSQNNPTPTARPVIWNWEREVYMEQLEEDVDGDALINSAGQPFDEPIEQEATRSVLVATVNVATLTEVIDYATTFSNAVNDATWMDLAARQVLCREVTSTPLLTEGANTYYSVTFRFALQPDGETWDRQFLQRGFKYIDAGEIINAKDKDGNLVSEPILLTAAGGKLAIGGTPVFTDPIKTRREADYGDLPF